MQERKIDNPAIHSLKTLALDAKYNFARDFAYLPNDHLAILHRDCIHISFINTITGKCVLIGKLGRKARAIEFLSGKTLSVIEESCEVFVSIPDLVQENKKNPPVNAKYIVDLVYTSRSSCVITENLEDKIFGEHWYGYHPVTRLGNHSVAFVDQFNIVEAHYNGKNITLKPDHYDVSFYCCLRHDFSKATSHWGRFLGLICCSWADNDIATRSSYQPCCCGSCACCLDIARKSPSNIFRVTDDVVMTVQRGYKNFRLFDLKNQKVVSREFDSPMTFGTYIVSSNFSNYVIKVENFTLSLYRYDLDYQLHFVEEVNSNSFAFQILFLNSDRYILMFFINHMEIWTVEPLQCLHRVSVMNDGVVHTRHWQVKLRESDGAIMYIAPDGHFGVLKFQVEQEFELSRQAGRELLGLAGTESLPLPTAIAKIICEYDIAGFYGALFPRPRSEMPEIKMEQDNRQSAQSLLAKKLA